MAPLVFLSHSGADTEAARELKRRLMNAPDVKAAGLMVWFDKDDLRPGGRRVVTASADNTAPLWDAETRREIAALEGHENSVLSAAFSPDGKCVVTASADETARVWEVSTIPKGNILQVACALFRLHENPGSARRRRRLSAQVRPPATRHRPAAGPDGRAGGEGGAARGA